ncbi:MMB_0454 family protein [Spiroplasma taiwanense]|uniref:Uncharacterized protein n=1 Tax=Spiroplasma taiwanense CT-1 TaxID=1276220 RepID=S5LWJ6_9MOLU|nr:hypothetical protein [Spiroplasma taiwanense]AGR41006.1 hypothetical protein STAIW_v1c03480 [Spiroplasma taiwanense CT-1]
MYISMERNSRGNLEIEEQILNKIIEFYVINNIKGFEKIEPLITLHQENHIFITIKIYVKKRDKLVIDEVKLSEIISNSIENTLNLKPKNIAFAFIK